MKQVSGGQLIQQLSGYTLAPIAASVLLTAASFAVLASMELLALRQAGSKSTRGISRVRGATAGFISHAFSQSLGFAVLTGAAVRLRAYSRENATPADIARVSAFVTITVTLGLLATGGASLLAGSNALTIAGYRVYLRSIGVALTVVLAAYFTWCSVPGSRRIGPLRWHAMRPRLRVASAQTLISALDWALAASVLFVLLPDRIATFREFLPAFFVAQTIAAVSHVPGGFGVFEAVLLALLGAGAMGVAGASAPGAAAGLAAALLVYRFVYYLLPLVIAGGFALVASSDNERRLTPSLPSARRQRHDPR